MLTELDLMIHDPGGKVKIALPAGTEGSAIYGGPDFCFRYEAEYRLSGLFIHELRTVLFVMMNPSTATAAFFDPTLAKCWRLILRWGYSRMLIGNTYAYRVTDQRALSTVADPIGPDNDMHLMAMAKRADLVVMAYGNPQVPALRHRGPEVARTLQAAGVPLHVLRLSGGGVPMHPLARGKAHIPELIKPTRWEVAA